VTNALTEDILVSTAAARARNNGFIRPARCLRCHTPAASYVLGVKTRQLNGNFSYPAPE